MIVDPSGSWNHPVLLLQRVAVPVLHRSLSVFKRQTMDESKQRTLCSRSSFCKVLGACYVAWHKTCYRDNNGTKLRSAQLPNELEPLFVRVRRVRVVESSGPRGPGGFLVYSTCTLNLQAGLEGSVLGGTLPELAFLGQALMSSY